uniref:Uncharacterized protein n=1 Tax=Anguilla anguilla TaxID=7936 RepID=A0A0E9XZZ8_ANGAN
MCNPGEAFGSTYKAFLNLCENRCSELNTTEFVLGFILHTYIY